MEKGFSLNPAERNSADGDGSNEQFTVEPYAHEHTSESLTAACTTHRTSPGDWHNTQCIHASLGRVRFLLDTPWVNHVDNAIDRDTCLCHICGDDQAPTALGTRRKHPGLHMTITVNDDTSQMFLTEPIKADIYSTDKSYPPDSYKTGPVAVLLHPLSMH